MPGMKTVKVLAINASPRRDGNTKTLLHEALSGLSDCRIPTEVVEYDFFGKRFQPCVACLQCYKNGGKCIMKDDFEELRELWLSADCVVYCLPVYVVGIPGQLKCFLDRLHNATGHYFPINSPRHLKTITCISQGCELYGGQELAIMDIIRHAVLINSIYVAPDGSFIGSSAWCGGMEKDLLNQKQRERPEDYTISVRTAVSAVRRSVELAAILRHGVGDMVDILQRDPRYQPYIHQRIFE